MIAIDVASTTVYTVQRHSGNAFTTLNGMYVSEFASMYSMYIV